MVGIKRWRIKRKWERFKDLRIWILFDNWWRMRIFNWIFPSNIIFCYGIRKFNELTNDAKQISWNWGFIIYLMANSTIWIKSIIHYVYFIHQLFSLYPLLFYSLLSRPLILIYFPSRPTIFLWTLYQQVGRWSGRQSHLFIFRVFFQT